MEKTIVREAAFRALFQFNFIDLKEVERESYMDDSLKNALDGEEFPEVLKLKNRHIAKTKILFEGTLANLEKIDEIIKAALKEDWSFSRLATAEKNILRLAVFEMKFDAKHLAAPIIITEALKLAEKYGSTDSSKKFVNGILSAISKDQAENNSTETD